MRRFGARIASLLGLAALVAAAAPACSQGDGTGQIVGTLNAPNCWTGAFELNADFFAAVPYRDSLQLRIQNGSDFQTFSDGLSILLHDITKIRPDPAKSFAGRYGESLRVDLPPEVTPPGVPVVAEADPALVSMVLYLQRTCRTQAITLTVVDQVTLPSDGSCTVEAVRGADPTQGCDPEREAPAGVGSGRSTIAFTAVANGKLDEEVAAERLIAGCFDVYLADPRESPGTEDAPPPPCRGHIRGSFSFFFERGRPSQPFP